MELIGYLLVERFNFYHMMSLYINISGFLNSVV